jgi:hypothetical protein
MELEHKEDERKNLVFTGIERYDVKSIIARVYFLSTSEHIAHKRWIQ